MNRFCPELETLEDRVVPTSFYWWGGGTGNWGTGSCWSLSSTGYTSTNGATPGSSDSAYFGGYSSNNCTLTGWTWCGQLFSTSGFNYSLRLTNVLEVVGISTSSNLGTWSVGTIQFGIPSYSVGTLDLNGHSSGTSTYTWNGGSFGLTGGSVGTINVGTDVFWGGTTNLVINGPPTSLGANLYVGYDSSDNVSPSTCTFDSMSGNLRLNNGASITTSSGGNIVFDQSSPGSGSSGGLDAAGSVGSGVLNYGTMKDVTTGGGSLYWKLPVWNFGTMSIGDGNTAQCNGSSVSGNVNDVFNYGGNILIGNNSELYCYTGFTQTSGMTSANQFAGIPCYAYLYVGESGGGGNISITGGTIYCGPQNYSNSFLWLRADNITISNCNVVVQDSFDGTNWWNSCLYVSAGVSSTLSSVTIQLHDSSPVGTYTSSPLNLLRETITVPAGASWIGTMTADSNNLYYFDQILNNQGYWVIQAYPDGIQNVGA